MLGTLLSSLFYSQCQSGSRCSVKCVERMREGGWVDGWVVFLVSIHCMNERLVSNILNT